MAGEVAGLGFLKTIEKSGEEEEGKRVKRLSTKLYVVLLK